MTVAQCILRTCLVPEWRESDLDDPDMSKLWADRVFINFIKDVLGFSTISSVNKQLSETVFRWGVNKKADWSLKQIDIQLQVPLYLVHIGIAIYRILFPGALLFCAKATTSLSKYLLDLTIGTTWHQKSPVTDPWERAGFHFCNLPLINPSVLILLSIRLYSFLLWGYASLLFTLLDRKSVV